jgi:hypothetical protein
MFNRIFCLGRFRAAAAAVTLALTTNLHFFCRRFVPDPAAASLSLFTASRCEKLPGSSTLLNVRDLKPL